MAGETPWLLLFLGVVLALLLLFFLIWFFGTNAGLRDNTGSQHKAAAAVSSASVASASASASVASVPPAAEVSALNRRLGRRVHKEPVVERVPSAAAAASSPPKVSEYGLRLHPRAESSKVLAPLHECKNKKARTPGKDAGTTTGVDEYIVVFHKDKVQCIDVHPRVDLLANHAGFVKASHTYQHLLRGFTARLTPGQLHKIRCDESVHSVHPNLIVQTQMDTKHSAPAPPAKAPPASAPAAPPQPQKRTVVVGPVAPTVVRSRHIKGPRVKHAEHMQKHASNYVKRTMGPIGLEQKLQQKRLEAGIAGHRSLTAQEQAKADGQKQLHATKQALKSTAKQVIVQTAVPLKARHEVTAKAGAPLAAAASASASAARSPSPAPVPEYLDKLLTNKLLPRRLPAPPPPPPRPSPHPPLHPPRPPFLPPPHPPAPTGPPKSPTGPSGPTGGGPSPTGPSGPTGGVAPTGPPPPPPPPPSKPPEVTWNMKRVAASLALVSGRTPADIYIVDTGIDAKHPNLNVVEKRSWVAGEPDAGNDTNGHGTHCSGIAAGRGVNGFPIGVCPGAPLHAMKVLNSAGSGTFANIISALDYIASVRAQNPSKKMVVSMSLGADVGDSAYNVLDDTVKSLVINSNIPVVVAAGNSAQSASLSSPAHTLEAFTVGAYDVSNDFASFSNYGNGVDLEAPGVDIKSTWPGNTTKILSGTSMATPHVAGAVALYLGGHALPTSVTSLWSSLVKAGMPSNSNPSIAHCPAQTIQSSLYCASL